MKQSNALCIQNHRKKNKYSSKRDGASCRLRKDNIKRNFGDTILCLNCGTTIGASSQKILDNRAVSQQLRNTILKGRVDSKPLGQVLGVQMESFNFFFGIQLIALVLRLTYSSLQDTRTCTWHIMKLSKLQKYVFHNYKA